MYLNDWSHELFDEPLHNSGLTKRVCANPRKPQGESSCSFWIFYWLICWIPTYPVDPEVDGMPGFGYFLDAATLNEARTLPCWKMAKSVDDQWSHFWRNPCVCMYEYIHTYTYIIYIIHIIHTHIYIYIYKPSRMRRNANTFEYFEIWAFCICVWSYHGVYIY